MRDLNKAVYEGRHDPRYNTLGYRLTSIQHQHRYLAPQNREKYGPLQKTLWSKP